jgi:thioredoxin reductase (NADPH)
MTTSEVENFPGFPNGIFGPELMLNMRQQAERFGTIMIDNEVVDVDLNKTPFRITTHNESYKSLSVIITAGASPRKLGIESEQAFAGRGVSYCATYDGPFFKGQRFVVVGGGDTALEEANYLSKFATSVTIVRRKSALNASKILQERTLSNPKIRVEWNSVITNIEGEKKVNTILIKNEKANQNKIIHAGGLFVAIGHNPNTSISQVIIYKWMIVDISKVRDYTRTNIDGAFAAGDVHDHRYRQAITAAGFGAMGALDCEKWLSERKEIGLYLQTN